MFSVEYHQMSCFSPITIVPWKSTSSFSAKRNRNGCCVVPYCSLSLRRSLSYG